jgi:hypothetical protein
MILEHYEGIYTDFYEHAPFRPPEIYLGQRIGRIALRQVVDWLRQCPEQWCRSEMALDQSGEPTWPRGQAARQWCSLGRLDMLTGAGKFHAGLSKSKADAIANLNDDADSSSDAADAIELYHVRPNR